MSTSAQLQRVGFDEAGDRALFVLAVDHPQELPGTIAPGTVHFVALIAWDSLAQPPGEVARVARVLLNAGCVYFCCWGLGCERMHDIVDEEYLCGRLSVNHDESTIMTTWHDEQSLEEAAWFALNCAFPDDRFFEECRSVVAICIGNHSWEEQLTAALAKPQALSSRVVDGSGNAA